MHVANIDGASRGNPGPASYGVVLRDPDGKIVLELAKNIGRETNNVAEYFALLAALDYATIHRISSLRIRSDSELLVRQMQGVYKVKSPDLKPLQERAAKQPKGVMAFLARITGFNALTAFRHTREDKQRIAEQRQQTAALTDKRKAAIDSLRQTLTTLELDWNATNSTPSK